MDQHRTESGTPEPNQKAPTNEVHARILDTWRHLRIAFLLLIWIHILMSSYSQKVQTFPFWGIWMKQEWDWSWIRPLYPDTKLNLGDRVLGEVEKNSFIAWWPQGANALKTVCPHLEGVVRSFIAMVQRGRNQLLDILLIGWGSTSSTFWFQLVWDLHACGQQTVNFSHLVGFQYLQNISKILFCVSLEGEAGPCPKAALLFLDCSSIVSASHPLP